MHLKENAHSTNRIVSFLLLSFFRISLKNISLIKTPESNCKFRELDTLNRLVFSPYFLFKKEAS